MGLKQVWLNIERNPVLILKRVRFKQPFCIGIKWCHCYLALFCEDSAYTPCQGDTLCSVHNMSGITLCCILGNPGAVRGGGKKIGAKKSQERGEELFSSFLTFLRPNFFPACLNFFPPPLTVPGSPRMIMLLKWTTILSS